MGLENGIGLDIILWFQAWRTPLVEAINWIFDFLGNEDFIFLILPLVYWSYDARLGRRVFLLFSLGGWTMLGLKDLVDSPRPYMISDQVEAMDTPVGFGLPSWHTGMSLLLWGMIGTKVKKAWYVWAVVVFVALMMVSRLSMGVHFPRDIIVGLLLGLVWLGAFIRFDEPVSAWLAGQSMWTRMGLATGLAALLTVIYPVLVKPYSQIEMDGVVTLLGAFWGSMLGIALETQYVGFSADSVWWQRVLRFVLGIAVFMAIRVGLDIVFEGLEPSEVFRFIRYTLAGLWIGVGAPWAFIKLKLAHQEQG